MVEKFVNKAHYNRYMYAVGIAKQINKVLESGEYTIVNKDNDTIDGAFEFEGSDGEPELKIGGIVYLGWEWEGRKIHIPPKKDIQKDLKSFKIMKLHKIKIKW